MSKLFKYTLIALLAGSFAFYTVAQDNNGKGNKDKAAKGKSEQKGDRDDAKAKKNQGTDASEKSNNGNASKKDKGNRDKDQRGSNGNGNNDDSGVNGNSDKKDRAEKVKEWKKRDMTELKWDKELFRERKEIRKAQKVTLCHKGNNNEGEPGVTINVSENALKAHLAHGDLTGTCPETTNTEYSQEYLNTRNAYFETLQEGYEQLLYSRSILDYAESQLAEARRLLQQAQSTPATVTIQVNQENVTELERNIEALKTLLNTGEKLVEGRLL